MVNKKRIARSYAAKNKTHHWKKGHSSSFNPEVKKHRLEAKKRSLFGNRGKGNLTESMLAQHNNETIPSICGDSDMKSIGGETALTSFTNCTLPSFNKLMTTFDCKSFLHKEMVAVLAAVTEILQSKGMGESETEYFAALMTTLEVVDTDASTTAAVSLLAILVKSLDETVLKAKCKVACETFVKLLIKYMNSEHTALLRHLLSLILAFFKVKTDWTDTTELNVLLECATHLKPRVRKEAKKALRVLLAYSKPDNANFHPCAPAVANYCVQRLEALAGKESTEKGVFHMFSFLEAIMCDLPTAGIRKCCETIFKVMTLKSALVTLCGFKALHGLFASKVRVNMNANLNAQVLSALYTYQPNINDTDNLKGWLQLMEQALLCLSSLDEKLCYAHLQKFFNTAVKCWMNNSTDLMTTVSTVLTNLLDCIDVTSDTFQQMLLEDPFNNAVFRMFKCVEEALGYQYLRAWEYVLSVLTAFFKVAGKSCYPGMTKCLHTLGNLHDTHNFQHKSDLERAVGMAIRHMGPRTVLKSIKLDINHERFDFPKSWLLPLLRDHIRNTELRFFIEYFLPLSTDLKKRAQTLKEGNIIESQLYETVCLQIWSLLPGFCTQPTDLQASFRGIAQSLGVLIRDDPLLRPTILRGLRLLIGESMENDETKAVLAPYAKNYLPILFNLHTTEPKDDAVYEAIKEYLQITDKDLCYQFYEKTKEKLLEPKKVTHEQLETQMKLVDLCKALVVYLGEEQVKDMYEYAKLLMQCQHKLQKRGYSLLGIICSSKSESCRSFVSSNLEDLKSLLCETVTALAPSTRALRLRCLEEIILQLTEKDKETLIEIIPEAVLCTKENSEKARKTAYDLLVTIGQMFHKFVPDQKDALREYLSILRAGLGGRVFLMSASVLAVARVIYEFKDELDSQMIKVLIQDLCILIMSPTREVVKAALSALQVVLRAVTNTDLQPFVQKLVESLAEMSYKNHRIFRLKAKELITKLYRKYGERMISEYVPEFYRSVYTNIRKTEARKKRNREMGSSRAEDDSEPPKDETDDMDDILGDSDDDDLDLVAMDNNFKKLKGKKKGGTCLEEDAEEEIVDFLDPTVNRKLITVENIEKKSVKKLTNPFAVASDGRLIIKDDEEEEDKKSVQKERNEKKEALADLMAFKSKKRKQQDSDEDDEDESNKKPKHGIHRSLKPEKKTPRPGEQYRNKKAGGDVKKGKFEPFAYMPLDRQALNKRKRSKMKTQFESIVKAAKQGAKSGKKQKNRDKKRMKNEN